MDAVSKDPADHSHSKSNREHGWVEQDFFPPPFDQWYQALVGEPFRNLRIHGDGANEFRDGAIERLLLSKRRCLLPPTRPLDSDAHRSIGPWLFRDGRTSSQRAVIGANLENAHSPSYGAVASSHAWNWPRPLEIN